MDYIIALLISLLAPSSFAEAKYYSPCLDTQKYVAGRVASADWDGELFRVVVKSRGSRSVHKCGGDNDAVFRACSNLKRGDRIELCSTGNPDFLRGDVEGVVVRREPRQDGPDMAQKQ